MTNYIRFDWAMKRLLRDKANHSVIEGLLTSLFGEKVTTTSHSGAVQKIQLKT